MFNEKIRNRLSGYLGGSVVDRDYASPALTPEGVALIRRYGKGVRGSVRAVRAEPLSQAELDQRTQYVLHARLP
jgi:hypothetical protein